MRRLHSHFQEWLTTLDPAIRTSIAAPSAWLLVTVTTVVSLAAAEHAPGAREFFQIDVTRTLVAYLPVLCIGIALGTFEHRGALSLLGFGVLAVGGAALFQYFMWSLVALSAGPGASAMALFPLLLASYHGQVLRSPPRHPYIAAGVLLGAAAAWLLHGDAHHTAIFAVAVPVAAGTSLVVGHIGVSQHRRQLEALALREAIDAQVMHESMQQAVAMRSSWLEVQSQHHDAGNILSGLLMTAERLAIDASRIEAAHPLRGAAGDLLGGLDRLRALFEEGRRAALGPGDKLDMVDLTSALRRTIHEVQQTNPGVRLAMAAEDDVAHVTIPVCGGDSTLHRILTNILLNACQGNSQARATSVHVKIAREESDRRIVIVIEDDGPGFPAVMLESPLRAFQTTKPHGTGLGLYTCDRLVRTSGGKLLLGNRHDAPGACVRISFDGEHAW